MGMSPRLKARRGRFGPAGLAPVVTITSAVVTVVAGSPETYTIDLAGTAFDDLGVGSPSSTDLSASIAWSSDVDGALGVGATLTAVALSAGPHVITATVTDGTKVGTDTVNVTAA